MCVFIGSSIKGDEKVLICVYARLQFSDDIVRKNLNGSVKVGLALRFCKGKVGFTVL